MSEGIQQGKKRKLFERLQIQSRTAVLWTIAYSIVGAVIYSIVAMIPMPFTMVSLFKFGLAPALAVIAAVGAIRGPIAGLLTGYIGEIAHSLILAGGLVTATLPALAYGIMGFIVGLARYEFARGRSLAKLSLLSGVGFVITTVLILAIGLLVEGIGTLAAIGFVFLPLLIVGLPSVVLLTPVLARLWHLSVMKIRPGFIAGR